MMHFLHTYIVGQLDRALREERAVVFYDAKRDFEAFIDELEEVGTGLGNLPRVCIGDTLTHIARFDGSFFALKASIEPVVSLDHPEALLVYIPGQARDRSSSVLMEIECAGHVYGDAPSHALKSTARRLLRKQFTDGDIDEMLSPDSLTYHDVVRFLGQGSQDNGSLLRLVLKSRSSEELIVEWISSEDKDVELASKLAEPELFRLLGTRIGLEIEEGTSLLKARHQTVRYLLVNEFRADLTCDAPDALATIPTPSDKEGSKRISLIVAALRSKHADLYIQLADNVADELGLSRLALDAEHLGAIDTFRFEERRLLHHAAELICASSYSDALEVVTGRADSFWLDPSWFLSRQAQWEACRLVARLGLEIDSVRKEIQKTPASAGKWITSYAADDGWHRVDRAQRALEAWVAAMEDDPEEPLVRALTMARQGHEALLEDMAQGFTTALVDSAWSTPDILHQTQVYPELVEPSGGRIAYFFVDAMRFEMGADLVDQLAGARDLRLQPAVAALPSITPMGMAALLPGASSSFSVVEHKGQLASQIGDSVLPSLRERLKLLKAIRPDSAEIPLDNLLLWSAAKVEKKIGDAPLVVVRSQEIDAFGESGHELAARQVMDSIIGNISRAVRKLSKLGIENFVITSDHGHQFSMRKAEDMMMDRPGGTETDQHRRCWAGHGGRTPKAAIRVTGAELGYDTDLDFVFPRGIAVFKAGGDLAFHHGGCSLQEMVVPVITLRMPSGEPAVEPSTAITLTGYPTTVTNRTFGCQLGYKAELFSQDAIAARVVVIGDGQEVGRAGMAPEAEFDRATATVVLQPGSAVNVGIMLTNDTSKKVRIVVQDPETDAILAQSDDMTIGELI